MLCIYSGIKEKFAKNTKVTLDMIEPGKEFNYISANNAKKVAEPGKESNCSAKNAKVNIDPEIVKIVGKPQEKTINIEKEKFDKVLVQAKKYVLSTYYSIQVYILSDSILTVKVFFHCPWC